MTKPTPRECVEAGIWLLAALPVYALGAALALCTIALAYSLDLLVGFIEWTRPPSVDRLAEWTQRDR